jgi:hypothetical protein
VSFSSVRVSETVSTATARDCGFSSVALAIVITP